MAGIWAGDLAIERQISIHGDELRPTASTAKIQCSPGLQPWAQTGEPHLGARG